MLKRFSNKLIIKNLPFRTVFRFSSSEEPEADVMEYDVLIVGGGPAGLASAIKLKQLEKQYDKPINVCLIEKGSEIGAHVISGNCFQPTYFNELFPNWEKMENKPPLNTKVTEDRFIYLHDQQIYFESPIIPQQLHNDGNYIISLSDLCKWMGEQATELGVEIYTGFAGDKVVYDDQQRVIGVQTGDFGISKTGEKKDTYTKGVKLLAKQTIFSEGCRGSLSERLIKQYNLRDEKDPQVYGIGLKEIWEVKPENFKKGYVQHTVGWPGDSQTYQGTFMYHMEPNLVHIGLITGLDYKNPHIYPYEEFQQFKTHQLISSVLEGGQCISYGARALNEGGYYSIPKLTFPGGVLAGCSAGFLSLLKIKGSHNAMKSGMLAAEEIYQKLVIEENQESGQELVGYEDAIKKSEIYKELHFERNIKGGFKKGLFPGIVHAGFISFISKGHEPWSLHNKIKDSETLKPIAEFEPKVYPKHDGVLTFDLLENLARSGTNHEHDQPSHLRIKTDQKDTPLISYEKYGAPEERFCPAKVYEFVMDENNKPKLQINAQNCLHCKCCSIKMINEYIDWNVPEGSGGPNYNGM